MRKLINHIPNLLTLGNLLAGILGIIMVFKSGLTMGAYFIWAGAVFDFFDGFSARSLKVFSTIGKDLDSLADMVTFGVLPAMIMYRFMDGLLPEDSIWPYVSCLITLFSALRLARFNIDQDQKEVFTGIPTPANAFLVSGLPFLAAIPFFHFIASPVFLVSFIVLTSLLMVSPFQFLSLKFKSFGIKENMFRYMIILSGLILLILMGSRGISLVIIFYILISFIQNFADHKSAAFIKEN